MSNCCDPVNCSLPGFMGFSVHGILFMGFSRQEYWSGLPFPSPGDLPDPGIKLGSPALQADSLPTELRESPQFIHSTLEKNVGCFQLLVVMP